MQFPRHPLKPRIRNVGITTFSDFIETSLDRIACDFSEAVPATAHGCRSQALTRGMGVSVSSRHSTAASATSSEPPWKKYRPSRAPHRLTHVLSERNIAPARSKWAKYCAFRRAGAKNVSRHPTTPHAGAVFLSPQPHPCTTGATQLAQHAQNTPNRAISGEQGEFCRVYRHGSHVSQVTCCHTCRKWWGFCTTRSLPGVCHRRVGASCRAIPPDRRHPNIVSVGMVPKVQTTSAKNAETVCYG